jgi:hypothetical protein
MRPATNEEHAWLVERSKPYVPIFEYLKANPGWQHLDSSDLPFTVPAFKTQKQALLEEASVRGFLLQVEEKGSGLLVRLLNGK